MFCQAQHQQKMSMTPKRGLTGTKRTSLGSLRTTKSSTTADNKRRQSSARKEENAGFESVAMKRRSTGCLRRPSVVAKAALDLNSRAVWRSPGSHAEIPNIFGQNCFLPYEDNRKQYALRASDPAKNISKQPWRPVGNQHTISPLPPLSPKKDNMDRLIRRALPNTIPVATTVDPTRSYHGFREVGTGVNGSVIGAIHRFKKNVAVAIKRCRLYKDTDYRAAVVRELRIMATGHPNLIRLRQVHLWREEVWMTMDLMRCSVFAVLCKRGLPEEFATHVVCEVLEALVFLHDKGYIHRDIKCENLLLSWNGQVKVADFGLATRTNISNKDRLGTSKWMAPEVIRELPYNEKIDMWSLGITLIEMMDRVPPHYLQQDDAALFTTILSNPGPTFSYSQPSMYMRGLVAWLLDHNPTTRPSASEVLLEIDAHIQTNLLRSCSTADLARFVHYVMSS